MRKYAFLKNPMKCNESDYIYKIMIYQTKNEGVFLFQYCSIDAIQCSFDQYYNDLEDVYDDWNDEIDERINRFAKYHSDNNNATIKRIISRSKAKSKERTEKKRVDDNPDKKEKRVLQDHSDGEI